MSLYLRRFLLAGVLLAVAMPAAADTLVLGDPAWAGTPAGAIDGKIADACMWVGWGEGMGLGTGVQFESGPSYVKHVLWYFDLAGAGMPIGPNTVIDSVQFNVSDAGGGHVAQPEINLYALTKAWTEAGETWYTTGTGTDWSTPGVGAGDIIESSKVSITTIGAADAWARFDIPGFDSLIQAWANGSITNYGALMVYAAEEGDVTMNMCSSQYASHVKPYLVVEYHVVPEPATMSLLGLGGLGMLIRRKRSI